LDGGCLGVRTLEYLYSVEAVSGKNQIVSNPFFLRIHYYGWRDVTKAADFAETLAVFLHS
jgi:hypothetical protein